MILHIAITTLLASMSACSDEIDPVLTQRDWDGTATYFQSTDEHGFSMYYKPQVGFVGDPMPFYDPVAKDFKVMYLQDYLCILVGRRFEFIAGVEGVVEFINRIIDGTSCTDGSILFVTTSTRNQFAERFISSTVFEFQIGRAHV